MSIARAFGLIFLSVVLGVSGCAKPLARGAMDTAPQAWVTTADGEKKLAPMPVSDWRVTAGAGLTLHVDSAQTYQTIAGFGASITDSSAWLIQNRLSTIQRDALLRDLFSRQSGLGLSVTRLTIGASDFSRAHYSYSASRAEGFDLAAARVDVVPTARAALGLNRELTIIASPWSAPAWMKTSKSLITGKLALAHYEDFATYLRDYVVGMGKFGVPVSALTIQNEPHFEPTNYPGMRMTPAERAVFVGRYLGPLLEREGLDVDILEWDHNWDEPQSPEEMLADPLASRYIDGVAWHCYGGDVAAQSLVHDAHPQLATWMTECSGGAWDGEWGSSLAWMTRTLIIGGTRNWARGVVLWNLALDENSGPHSGGCGNCRGVVTINQQTGEITRNVEYYVLGHASRFVHTGAQRIASDTDVSGLESVAFKNGDGSVALIVLNSAAQAQKFDVDVGARRFEAELPAGAVATYTWSSAVR